MANDEEVGVRLSLKDRKRFSSDADRAAKDIKKISQAADGANRSTRAASSGVKSLSEATSGIRHVASFGIRAAGAMTAGVSALGTAAGLMGIKTAAGFEQSEIAFGVLLKSTDRAKSLISDLRQYAESSPFDLMSVQTGAQRLLAMGFSAKEIMPMMKTFGNAAAGGIVPLEEGLWRLTYAFGQMKAAGRVQGDELRQIEEMGIGVRKALSEGFGIPMKELPKAIREGKLEGDKAIAIITKAIDRDFGGMVDAQAKSWTGMWARLKEVARNNAGDTARAMMDPFKPAFADLGNRADRFGKKITGLGQRWSEQFSWWRANGAPTLSAMVWALDDVTGAQGGVTNAFNTGKGIAQDIADVWKNSLWPAIQDLTSALGGKEGLLAPLGLARDILSWMADHPDAAKAIFEGAAIAITSWKLAQLIQGVTAAVWGLNAAMAANPIGLVIAATVALAWGLNTLYNKLNDGRPAWEGWIAALFPGLGMLMTIKNHLRDIGEWLGFIDKKKNVPLGPFMPTVTGAKPPPKPSGPGVSGLYPGQAAGGITTRSGASWVAENGPELITLPRGARVDPLPQGDDMPSFGPNVNVYVSGADVLHAQRVADVVVERIQDKLART